MFQNSIRFHGMYTIFVPITTKIMIYIFGKFQVCSCKTLEFPGNRRICSKWAPCRCRQNCTRRAKFSMTLLQIGLNNKRLILRCSWHLEARIWWTVRTLCQLGWPKERRGSVCLNRKCSTFGGASFLCQVCLLRQGAHLEHILWLPGNSIVLQLQTWNFVNMYIMILVVIGTNFVYIP